MASFPFYPWRWHPVPLPAQQSYWGHYVPIPALLLASKVKHFAGRKREYLGHLGLCLGAERKEEGTHVSEREGDRVVLV